VLSDGVRREWRLAEQNLVNEDSGEALRGRHRLKLCSLAVDGTETSAQHEHSSQRP